MIEPPSGSEPSKTGKQISAQCLILKGKSNKNLMGIAVWGIIDKCSWVELGLWAMPDARVPEMPPASYLRLVKEKKGKRICILFHPIQVQVQVV